MSIDNRSTEGVPFVGVSNYQDIKNGNKEGVSPLYDMWRKYIVSQGPTQSLFWGDGPCPYLPPVRSNNPKYIPSVKMTPIIFSFPLLYYESNLKLPQLLLIKRFFITLDRIQWYHPCLLFKSSNDKFYLLLWSIIQNNGLNCNQSNISLPVSI